MSRRVAVHGPVEQCGSVQGYRRLGAGQIHPLTFAGTLSVEQGQHDGHGHVVTAGMIHIGVAPPCRRLVRQRGRKGQARDRLHDGSPGLVFVIGADVAEAAVGDVDDVRFDGLELLVAEAPSVEHAGGKVLGDRVGYLDQFGENLFAFVCAQVERDAELVGVVVVEAAAVFEAFLPGLEGRDAA